MRMRLAGQQFGRTLADPLGSFAPQETTMVEEELEQGQIVRPQMPAKKEVAAQPTVEVLNNGTGSAP